MTYSSLPSPLRPLQTEHNEIDMGVPVTAEISFAMAIYPHTAEQEVHFDVVSYVLISIRPTDVISGATFVVIVIS